ncbi:hypothetical protein V8C86DRAFT_2565244 [Haematococcus lacustris]
MAGQGWGAVACVVVSTVVVGPVREELLYRGFIFQSLATWLPLPAAVASSSLLFAASHQMGLQTLPLTGLGAVLAASLVLAKGNLVVPVVSHALYNAAVLGLATWGQAA